MARSEPLPFTIRPARPTDAAALSPLATAVFRHTYGAAIPTTTLTSYLTRTFSVAAIELALADPATFWLVAAREETLVGYCKLVNAPVPGTQHNALEVVNLYLDQRDQGQGIGQALLHAAEAHALAQACATLWLCVWQENQAALAFYQRRGFAITGTTTIFVDEIAFADWIMVKPLVPQ